MPTPSGAPAASEVLAGPVEVCVDRPILALDRPFTYDLSPELEAGVGSLVRVRFAGKLTRGWVLGPSAEIPRRILPVLARVAPVRAFDDRGLALARWIAERYVSPLATAIGAMSPPRVAGEEDVQAAAAAPIPPVDLVSPRLTSYRGGSALLAAVSADPGSFVLRPSPEDEQALVVETVGACLHAGRRAIVVVPEASPLPATAAALRDAFGGAVCLFLGGDRRGRYRSWLDIRAGAFAVVVGTRPAVFAPLEDLGLLFVSRESHPAHHEDRAPYHHVREVALRRGGAERAAVVLAAACPSSEAAALGLPIVTPARRRWPRVEVVRPGVEGRAPRLLAALRGTRRGFVYAPVPGAGIAQICRTCGAPAACAACGGPLRLEEGAIRCIVCQAPGRCAVCGGADFGIRRGGAERVEAWVRGVAAVPVSRPARPRLPHASGEIVIGGAERVRDLGVGGLDLVAVLDADEAERRSGLAGPERALTIWMEAVGWARPDARVIVQSSHPGDPALQALVRGNPDRFWERERERRAAAGFPVGAPVFRVVGTAELDATLAAIEPITALTTTLGDRTVCLLALEPGRVPAFGRAMRDLAGRGVVERVEAEPQL
ncbi:MAG TPA: hypothetical protein VK646_05365 [Actinomycetota bacterium]|nr:hypothetical protein [Actinomycetota bacterium]